MAGIVFVKTKKLDEIVEFYCERVGMEFWFEQPNIIILSHDNLLIGFHQEKEIDTGSLFTFIYQSTDEVDQKYQDLLDIATTKPSVNTKYRIYNFFAQDPEGRLIEFQKFLDDIPPI